MTTYNKLLDWLLCRYRPHGSDAPQLG